MADQPSPGTGGPTPIRTVPVTMLVQYLKDVSFESPGAPGTLGSATELRQGSVSVDVRVVPMGDAKYEVILHLRVEASHENKTIYLLEMEYAGMVQIGAVPAERVEPLLMIESPRLLFPYARAIVTDLTRDGGFAPLLINPIDFAVLYHDYRRKNQPAETPAATAS